MLEKFNNLFSKVIFESTENTLETMIYDITACDSFFKGAILPQATENNLEAFKARYNTFRLYGKLSDVIRFFKNFKTVNVNKDFVILNPLACFCDEQYTHKLLTAKTPLTKISQGDEGNSMIVNAQEKETAQFDKPETLGMFNKDQRQAIMGRWFDLISTDSLDTPPNYQEDEYDFGKKVKAEIPSVIAKNLKNLAKKQRINITKAEYENEPMFYIEFSTNYNCLPNESYENETFFVNPNEVIKSNNKKGK